MIVILIVLTIIVLYIIQELQKTNGAEYRNTLHKIKTAGVANCANYSSFVNNNKNLEEILSLYNSLINNPNRKVLNLTSEYIETSANISEEFQLEINKIIDKILLTINNNNRTDFNLLNIERVIVKKNILNERETDVLFLVSEKNKFSTRKILLKYGNLKQDNYIPHIDYIRTVQSAKDSNIIEPFIMSQPSGARIFNNLTINNQIKLLNKIVCGKDKCLNKKLVIDKIYQGEQSYTLNNRCQIINHGSNMEKVFVNPTVFPIP